MFETTLLDWYEKNHRKLPWRANNYFYNVWISEIMLQQTRVNQMTEFYHRFITAFPSLDSLAKAEQEQVLKKWQGLGYYSRAINLHLTAKHIYFELNNQPPNSFEKLKTLKGIGDYTAAAIASICYKETVCAVDGNVFRVFSRYFDIDMDISLSGTKKYFFELGNQIISKENPGDFNQALMELGATICLPKKAACQICPIKNGCLALCENKVYERPVKSKKVKVRKRFLNYFYCDQGFLFEKRTQKDIWYNLYQFPLIETEKQVSYFKSIEGLKIQSLQLKEKVEHNLTHQRLIVQFWKISFDEKDFSRFIKGKKLVTFEKVEDIMLPIPKIFSNFMLSNKSNF